jgi:hypothetical protein
MDDWSQHLDRILVADDRELLDNAGKISTISSGQQEIEV